MIDVVQYLQILSDILRYLQYFKILSKKISTSQIPRSSMSLPLTPSQLHKKRKFNSHLVKNNNFSTIETMQQIKKKTSFIKVVKHNYDSDEYMKGIEISLNSIFQCKTEK